MFDAKEQDALNKEHLDNPQEGDYWHEMYSPYFLVVAVDPLGVLVLDKTMRVDEGHFTFDITQPKYMSMGELKHSLVYKTIPDKCMADVIPYSKRRGWQR